MRIYTPLLLTYILWILPNVTGRAQISMIGIQIGYGKSASSSYGLQVVSPLYNSNYNANYYRIGIEYIKPLNHHLGFTTGIGYHMRAYPASNYNYIHIPFSPEIVLGRKMEIIVGAGIDLGIFILQNHKSDIFIEEEKHNFFQLGWQGHLGLGYNFYPDLKARVIYQNYFDITTSYKYGQHSPGGVQYSDYEKWYDGMINVSMLKTLDSIIRKDKSKNLN